MSSVQHSSVFLDLQPNGVHGWLLQEHRMIISSAHSKFVFCVLLLSPYFALQIVLPCSICLQDSWPWWVWISIVSNSSLASEWNSTFSSTNLLLQRFFLRLNVFVVCLSDIRSCFFFRSNLFSSFLFRVKLLTSGCFHNWLRLWPRIHLIPLIWLF